MGRGAGQAANLVGRSGWHPGCTNPAVMLRHALPIVALSVLSTTSSALPPNAPRNLRPGANHHTGDDGFVAHLGRDPKSGAEEKLRMHEHFVAVRARLAAKPATRPELEARRQQILAYLDAYIAKGTTPDNTHLPWTTPVFIDDKGTICAVGYLIEQSAGRALAEQIATKHRYDFIEDIAKDMPEVRAWVEASGFTLDELGQIQPGYMGPDVLQWHPWDLEHDEEAKDGPYEQADLRGTLRNNQLEGVWTKRGPENVVLGTGSFLRGKGTWTSTYPRGATMAEGAFVANRPSGPWRMYHESGNLAAEGSFVRGQRSGAWRFYYDTKDKTPIALGRFSKGGSVTGTWKHYDATGTLLASSVVATPRAWQGRQRDQLFWSIGYLLEVAPGPDKIQHQIHQGSIDGAQVRLDKLATPDGEDRIYYRYTNDEVFDVDGYKLVKVDGGWRADDCKWSKARKRAARAGDLARLHGLIFRTSGDDETTEACSAGKPVSQARGERITRLVATMTAVRAVSPRFIQQLALGELPQADEADAVPEDLMHVLAQNMSLDIEWPHVDLRFVRLYETLPGYSSF
ncbi:MAG: hypothetical protein H6Q90_1914 [Deltaproteobacteria bacterium]|nr:hypothetical protein [Deltaproteobacteria bacterium]